MFEMPHACKDHCEIMLIGCGYDFVVSDGTAWLNHGRDPVTRGFVDAVAKGKEGIRREH